MVSVAFFEGVCCHTYVMFCFSAVGCEVCLVDYVCCLTFSRKRIFLISSAVTGVDGAGFRLR